MLFYFEISDFHYPLSLWNDNNSWYSVHLYDLQSGTQQHNIIAAVELPALSEENGCHVIMVHWSELLKLKKAQIST